MEFLSYIQDAHFKILLNNTLTLAIRTVRILLNTVHVVKSLNLHEQEKLS
jgi:hypothetical protein